MKVERWGKYRAVRPPQEIVEALGLREGDDIKLTASERPMTEQEREDAPARIRALRKAPDDESGSDEDGRR